MNIINDFYSEKNYLKMLEIANNINYKTKYQPERKEHKDRLKAMYPCYETDVFKVNEEQYKIFIDTFEEKTKIKTSLVVSIFRKILSSELEIIFKYGTIPHQDSIKFDIAGLIYYEIDSLYDGTAMYEGWHTREPTIIIGAKSNRCVFYNSQAWHAPLQKKETETRLVQPFFIKLKTN